MPTAALRRQLPDCEVILRRNAECVRNPIEEREHCGDVDGFRDLVFAPPGIAELLYIGVRRPAGSFGDELHVVDQSPLSRSQPGFIELTLENCAYALIAGSLNPQEVGMTVQSIRTAVQVGDVAGNHLLVAAGEMTF